MSEYKTIFGKAIKSLSSDPTDAGAEGQIWYNTTTGSFRTVLSVGAWASSTAVNTERSFGASSGGPITSSLFFGGYYPGDAPPNTGSTRTEQWNGSSWTEVNDSNTRRYNNTGIIDDANAALMTGGFVGPPGNTNANELWDGTNWTTVNNYPQNIATGGAGGTTSSGIYVSGGLGGGTYSTDTNEWDGTNWTAGGAYPTGTQSLAVSAASSSDAVAFGGRDAPPTNALNITNSYNGTSWSSENTLNTGRKSIYGSGNSSTSAWVAGGTTDPATKLQSTETWDGTSWTTKPSMATNSYLGGSAGTSSTNGLAISGLNTSGSAVANVEEFTSAPVTKTFTTS